MTFVKNGCDITQKKMNGYKTLFFMFYQTLKGVYTPNSHFQNSIVVA